MERGGGQPFSLSAYRGRQVAAVISARNEERTIGEAVAGALPFVHEVIVMDGRSSDRTAAIASSMGARVHTDPGRGKGAAVRQSLTLAGADVIVFMDADGSHDPADIPRLALPVVRGEAELCVGSRFTGGSEELSLGVGQLIRSIGNISMNIAINRRWHVALTDTLNGFRAVDRRAALAIGLRQDRHTIEQEMVMKMLRHGYRVINTPTHEYRREFGESHINIWREWPEFVGCTIANLIPRDVPAPRSALDPDGAADPARWATPDG